MLVNTVLGDKKLEELGLIDPHEHLFIDVWSKITKTSREKNEEKAEKKIKESGISIEELGDLKLDVTSNLTNLVLSDFNTIFEELSEFKKLGGQTIIEQTNGCMGRDVTKLKKISKKTGINIITSTGYYIGESIDQDTSKRSEEKIAETMVKEINNGIGSTNIKAGVIGEIGISKNIKEIEKKVLKAACLAQNETGKPLFIHIWPFSKDGHKVLDICKDVALSLEKIVICHVDGIIDIDYIKSILDRGCYVEFDHFGKEYKEVYKDKVYVISNDVERIQAIKEIINKNKSFNKKILLANDRCLKTELRKYGGFGYAHILRTIIKYMKIIKYSDEEINILIEENPKRLFI